MNNYLISAPEVVELMGVSESMAYRIIKKCNEELTKKGFITVFYFYYIKFSCLCMG